MKVSVGSRRKVLALTICLPGKSREGIKEAGIMVPLEVGRHIQLFKDFRIKRE